MPVKSAFKGDAKRKLEVNEDEEEGLNADDVDNRMSRDKIIRILRDYVIKENSPIKEAMDLVLDAEDTVDKDALKEAIKRVTGSQAAYDDILKCIMYFHTQTVEKEKLLAENVVVVDSEGSEAGDNKDADVKRVKFSDFELALTQALQKAGHKSATGHTSRSLQSGKSGPQAAAERPGAPQN